MPRKRPAHRQQQQDKQELINPEPIHNGLVVASFGAKLDVEDDDGTIVR